MLVIALVIRLFTHAEANLSFISSIQWCNSAVNNAVVQQGYTIMHATVKKATVKQLSQIYNSTHAVTAHMQWVAIIQCTELRSLQCLSWL